MAINILYANSIPYLGGAEISLLTLMTHLDQARYRPHLITSKPEMLSMRAKKYNIPVSIQSFPRFSRRWPWPYIHSIWSLIITIRLNHISLVHTNCDRSLSHVRWACQLTHTPYVSHVRDCVRGWFYPHNLAALNKAKYVIANCKAITNPFIKSGVSAEQIEVVYNPISFDQHSCQIHKNTDNELKLSLKISPNDPIIGLVGQIQPIKGQDDLIRAASMIIDIIPNAHFLIVGDANDEPSKTYLQQLKKLVRELNIVDQVHFLGFRDDILKLMQVMDVLVVPSKPIYDTPKVSTEDDSNTGHSPLHLRQIGFGRVVIEGMTAGCAVIATALDGMSEVLEHNYNGLLVPPSDVEALVKATIRLMQNADLRERLVLGGIQTSQKFTAEKHGSQIQSIYDSVLKYQSPRN